MILEIALIDVIPGQEEAFEQDIRATIMDLTAYEGCHRLEIVRSVEKPSRYRFLVTWETIEHHFRIRGTKAVAPINEVMGRYAAGRQDTEHMNTILSLTL